MRALSFLPIMLVVGISFPALSQLKTQDMGNQQVGRNPSNLFSVDSMPATTYQPRKKQLGKQNRGVASQQQPSSSPQVSEAQMQEMMKVLQDYKKQTEERNKALEQLMAE